MIGNTDSPGGIGGGYIPRGETSRYISTPCIDTTLRGIVFLVYQISWKTKKEKKCFYIKDITS